MAIDWDKAVLAPLEKVFGEGGPVGSRIKFHPYEGEAYDIDGIFDAAYRDVTLDPTVAVNTTCPVLGVRLDTFKIEPVPGDDQVYIPRAGKMFLIKEVRPDSHGGAKLMLGEM